MGGEGVAQAWQCGEWEETAVRPGQELLEVVGRRWAASLVAEDGRNQLEGVEWRHWRHGHIPRNGMKEWDSRQGASLGPGPFNLRTGENQGDLRGPPVLPIFQEGEQAWRGGYLKVLRRI